MPPPAAVPLIVFGRGKRCAKLREQIGVHGIENRRPIEGDGHDPVGNARQDSCFTHERVSL